MALLQDNVAFESAFLRCVFNVKRNRGFKNVSFVGRNDRVGKRIPNLIDFNVNF